MNASFAGITQAGSAGMISARKTRAPRWGESTQSPFKINRLQRREESATFCEQKVAKKLYFAGPWALSLPQPMAQRNKSFLRRFFSKKRPLAP